MLQEKTEERYQMQWGGGRETEISNLQNEILIAGVRCPLRMSEPLLTLYWELNNIKNEGDAKEVEERP